ncbi:MAG: hypothetical protein ACREK2_09555 [Gemmatimonadota bacterium]
MGLIVLGSPAAIAQDSPEVVEPVRGKECDPIWDGPLFGVLPGIAVSTFVVAFSFCGETADDDCGSRIIFGGIAGAGAGLLLDKLHCAGKEAPSEEAPNERMQSDRSGIAFDPEFRFTAQPASMTRADSL